MKTNQTPELCPMASARLDGSANAGQSLRLNLSKADFLQLVSYSMFHLS